MQHIIYPIIQLLHKTASSLTVRDFSCRPTLRNKDTHQKNQSPQSVIDKLSTNIRNMVGQYFLPIYLKCIQKKHVEQVDDIKLLPSPAVEETKPTELSAADIKQKVIDDLIPEILNETTLEILHRSNNRRYYISLGRGRKKILTVRYIPPLLDNLVGVDCEKMKIDNFDSPLNLLNEGASHDPSNPPKELRVESSNSTTMSDEDIKPAKEEKEQCSYLKRNQKSKIIYDTTPTSVRVSKELNFNVDVDDTKEFVESLNKYASDLLEQTKVVKNKIPAERTVLDEYIEDYQNNYKKLMANYHSKNKLVFAS